MFLIQINVLSIFVAPIKKYMLERIRITLLKGIISKPNRIQRQLLSKELSTYIYINLLLAVNLVEHMLYYWSAKERVNEKMYVLCLDRGQMN